jgi:putative membrane-bound dehydrogenase-like protein
MTTHAALLTVKKLKAQSSKLKGSGKSQCRMPNVEGSPKPEARMAISDFALRPSFVLRPSSFVLFLLLLPLAFSLCPSAFAAPVSLFDGKTLDGWDGDPKMWWVEDGAITGGSRTEKITANYFIATKRSFQNFELRLKIKCSGDPATGMINSGIQIRSVRVPGGHHMSGYQVDCGAGWFGKIYDEFRRNRVIWSPTPDQQAALDKVVDVFGWNEYRIRAEGPRIRTWINGVLCIDYTETDKNIALDGQIAPQVHSGGVALVQFKDVTIEELPPTPGAPTWESLGGVEAARKLAPPAPKAAPKKGAPAKKTAAAPDANTTKTGRDISYNAAGIPAQTPEEQRQSFKLPPGFEIELVAAESEGIGKFIAVDWDARGRMWSMTALEYPVDANENKAASDALFAKGGRDKVVVWDNPYGAPASGPAQPRIFADNLVMPLGILPYQDGAFVQYGADIRLYRDTDGDGRADKHDVILTGFGTQDSHLFPHQFTRAPGGWLLLAQGLFNYSKIRRPDGSAFADGSTEIPFNQCKLARMTLDGSMFENLTAGPNNIWGLTVSRTGETWIQEANDQGNPIVPYEPGIHVRTGSKEKLRPYQPLFPGTINPPQMGGTGLSGLALADDRGSPFQSAAGVSPAVLTSSARNPDGTSGETPKAHYFYLANPITSTINVIRATPDGPRYRYEKLPDFITTTDRWFRPVAIAFGPDGCLYITDWYNKIISHNEVPRTHPDRDKTRGRIWRVRHTSQPRITPPDLTKLSDKELLAHLGDANSAIARLAWLEITDRKATSLAPDLEKIVADKSATADRRLGALWALEGLTGTPRSGTGAPAGDSPPGAPARRTAMAGEAPAGRTQAGAPVPLSSPLLASLAADPNPNLRHEAARIAAAQPRGEEEFIRIVAPLVNDPSPSVRAAVGDALRRVPKASPRVMALAAQLGREPLAAGSEMEKYEREFDRYLARWAMEVNPQSTAALLASSGGKALPLENRLLATLALGGKDSAIGLAKLVPELRRPLGDEEVRALAAHFGEPAVSAALSTALANADSRTPVLRALLNLRTSLDTTKLTPALTAAAQTLLSSTKVPDVTLGAEVAAAFKLPATEPALVDLLTHGIRSDGGAPGQTPVGPHNLIALRALRELGGGPADVFEKIALNARNPDVRTEALAALAASKSPDAAGRLVKLLPNLSAVERGTALDRLAGSKAGATALMAGLKSGAVARADVGLSTVERLRLLLPKDESIAALWKELGGDAKRALRLGGAHEDYVATQLTLDGPFTIECWAKLDAGIGNQDAILGASGQLSVNFYNSTFRVWIKGANDIVVAKKKTTPGAWTHYAVTRDTKGVFRIFINGELDATSTKTSLEKLTGLNVGRTTVNTGGTAGWLAEYRVWNVARSAKDIRENFDRTFQGEAKPAALTHHYSGANWGKLSGAARTEPVEDLPTLLTEAEATVQEEKFAKFRSLANSRGNPEHGKELFTSVCITCHQQGGKGGQIAPALDGVANTGVEAILRNILTPNAAMEGGYRKYRVETKDDELVEGLLVSEDAASIVLRQPNVPDQRIPRANVKRAGFLTSSMMPEGLLEGMQPEQVSDLFAYLKSLR